MGSKPSSTEPLVEATGPGSVRPPRHLHVIEPRADGHRLAYVRRLLRAAPAGSRLSFSTFASTLQHPAMAAVHEAAGPDLQIHLMAGDAAGEAAFEARLRGRDGFALQPAYWQLLRRHWRSLAPAQRGALALLPYLDYASYAIGALGSPLLDTPFAGIVMRPDFHWAEQGVQAPPARHRALKRWLFLRLLAQPRLQRLVSIDPSLADWVAKQRPVGHHKLLPAEDPADVLPVASDPERARQLGRSHYGLQGRAPVLLLYGSIEARKGLAGLAALAASPGWPAGAQVLVVGRQGAAAQAVLASAAAAGPVGRWVFADRHVDAREEALAFAAADAVWVAYEGFYGPSGVVAQCRQLGLPMINRAGGEGLIGYQLKAGRHLDWPWLAPCGLRATLLAAPADAARRDIAQVIGGAA